METITINCPPCFHCGERAQVKVLKGDFDRWQGGELIQRAFPEMPADQREMLITGTHPACWDAMMSEEE